MDDLVRWLGAQLDEDERIARAACWDDQSDVWTARPPQASYERYTVVDYLGDGVVAVTPENADADGVGRHVAEWGPARVLREIDAKRQALDHYAECARAGKGGVAAYRMAAGAVAMQIAIMALPYADRPGYREEWRP